MLQKGGEQGAELPQLLQADQRPGEGQGRVGCGGGHLVETSSLVSVGSLSTVAGYQA